MTATRGATQDTGLDVVQKGMRDPVCIPLALLADRQLNLNDLRVLLALYAFADSTGTSQPTRDTLATVTGLPTSRISTITTRLATLGWLEKQSGSGKSSTRYQLHPLLASRSGVDSASTPVAQSGFDAEQSDTGARATSAANSWPGSDPVSQPAAASPEPDLRRKIKEIVHEELTRLNGAGHLAGGDIAPDIKLRLKRFRKGDGG